MYADWSSLTLQLQSLGSATQSVLAKLPQEDGKQVTRLCNFFGYQIWVKCTNLLLLGFGNAWSKVGLSGNCEREGGGFLVHTLILALRHGNQCCGSMTFWYGSESRFGSGSSIIVSDLKTPTKNQFNKMFFCLLFFEGTFTSFFKDKKSKRSRK